MLKKALTLCTLLGATTFSEPAEAFAGDPYDSIVRNLFRDAHKYSYSALAREVAMKLCEDSSRYHTVRPGDNLWKIARHYYGKIEEIALFEIKTHYPILLAQANNIEVSDVLHPGQRLLIPNGLEQDRLQSKKPRRNLYK